MSSPLIFENYFGVIYITSFFTSIVSTAISFAGGTMLLAMMAQFLPLPLLIPLHALIQLFSNLSRGWMLRRYVDWSISMDAIIGSFIGAVFGYFVMLPVQENIANLILGVFILFITLFPKANAKLPIPRKWILIGFIATSLGLLVGAIGTLVGALLLSENLDKKSMVGTQAALQAFVHLSKLAVFISLGFIIWPWVLLVGGSILFTSLGSFVGTKILDFIPQNVFYLLVKATILILGLKLLIQGAALTFK